MQALQVLLKTMQVLAEFFNKQNNIKKFLNLSKEEQKILGQNGRAYFNIEFEREILVDRLEKILDND